MSSIRLKNITVEPLEILSIDGGDILINSTTDSQDLITASLVLSGGISINATEDSTGLTTGGAITSAGGLTVLKRSNFGSDVNILGLTSVFSIEGTSIPRFFVDDIFNKSITISPDGVSNRFELTDTQLLINISADSTSISNGALVVNGGIGIDKNVYIGGDINVLGNATFGNNVEINSNLTIDSGSFDMKNSSGSVVSSMSIGSGDALNVNTTEINISGPNGVYINDNLSILPQSSVFQKNLTINDSTASVNETTAALVVIGGISASGISVYGNSFLNEITTSSLTTSQILFNTSASIANSNGNLIFDASSLDYNLFKVDSNGIINISSYSLYETSGNLNINTTNPDASLLLTGISTANLSINNLDINSDGTGYNIVPTDLKDLNIYTNLVLKDTYSEFDWTKASISSTEASVVFSGGISINETENASSITSGGAITISGGAGISGKMYLGNDLDINGININSSSGVLNISSSNIIFSDASITSASFSIYSLNSGSNYEIFSVNNNNPFWEINALKSGSGVIESILLNNTLTVSSGSVGINTTNPNYALEINGTVYSNDNATFKETFITSTVDATNYSDGSLRVSGGASVSKTLFANNLVSNSSTTGDLLVSGTAIIETGCTISNGLYVSGGIINAGGPSSIDSIVLTSTQTSTNSSTGALVLLNGGISVNSTENSSSSTRGGSLTVAGGTSIFKDLYLGQNLNLIDGSINSYSTEKNSFIIYDNLIGSLKQYSLGRSSGNFNLSRYNTFGVFLEDTITINGLSGITNFNNTTAATYYDTAGVVISGGLAINATEEALSFDNGGGLLCRGGASIDKNLIVGGNVVIYDSTQSVNASSGSLVLMGGLGVNGNVNIIGDTTITGGLIVNGTTTSINTTNTLIDDNIIVLNSGPLSTRDAGFMISRYQLANDVASGDVVSDSTFTSFTLPSQSGVLSTEIKLPASASSVNDYYIYYWIKVVSGFSINQVRRIVGYNGSTKVATIETSWTTQNPSIGDSVELYDKPFVGLVYNELEDTFDFGSTTQDPGYSNVSFTDYLPVRAKSFVAFSTDPSINSSTGSVILSGGLSIYSSADATSSTYGGGMTIAGGAAIEKSVYIGSNLIVNNVNMTPNSSDILSTQSFTGANNVTDADFTPLYFGVTNPWGVDIYIAARVTATTNLYSNYHIRAVNMGATWNLVSEYVGDQIAAFNITASGQITYTTTNFSGFSDLTFKFKVISN